MYGGAYPPYPAPGQQPPVGYGPPPGSFPAPPGSSPFPQPGVSPQQPVAFNHPPGGPPNSLPQPSHPLGFGPPPPMTPSPQQQPPQASQAQLPSQTQQQQPTQLGLPPPPGHLPFPHLPPPPGFPHLHPPHLSPGVLPQPHPAHQFPHLPIPGGFGHPSRHPGLGAHGQPHNINSVVSPPLNLPASGSHTQAPGSAPVLPSRPVSTEIYSLFVGSIAEGVDDAWLERLLGCAGHLVSLRRIRDPNGKPKPFGFAEYGDPESVLRCLQVIHGVNLPIDGGRGGEKSLMIKPDDKTKARLDAYEATRIKTDQDTELDEQAVERLEGLVSQMKDPDIVAATASDLNSASNSQAATNGNSNSKKNSAAHLQDLAPEDLPEESRGTITREIQFFRERAISKRGDAEKAAKERERGGRDSGSGSPIAPRGYGGSNNKSGHVSSNNTPMGPRGTASAGNASSANDPQSFNRPMGFVRAGQMAAAQQHLSHAPGSSLSSSETFVPLTDEEEDRLREERRKRMNHMEFKDRERRWETRERNRAQTNQRDQQREKSIQEDEVRLRNQMKARLAHWDDEIEMERGKELFYSNRHKWRTIRRTFRQREEKSDRIDEELEQEQREAIRKESEDFLNRQAEMLAKIQDENRKAGLLQLDEGGKPIQLSFGGFSANHALKQNGTGQNGNTSGSQSGIQPISLKKEGKAGGALLGNADDEDDGFRKKRALIPLTYDDDESKSSKQGSAGSKIQIRFGKSDPNAKEVPPVLTEEKKKKKIKDIVAAVPTDKNKLWQVEIKWEWLNESIINDKLKPFANKKIIEYLGLQEDELVTAIVDHIRAKKGAQGLVEELEPVLAEEAEEFTLKFWRMLVFEIKAAEAGLTSTPTVP